MEQEERAGRSVQDADDKDDVIGLILVEGLQRKMLKFLEDSEVAKVSMRE